jgi:hypothetical protein
MSVNWNYSASHVRFSWVPGANGDSQAFGVSEDYLDLVNPKNCNSALGANCIELAQELPTTKTFYDVQKSKFILGRSYYWGVMNVASPLSCSRRMMSLR